MSIYSIYFSPTQGTKNITNTLAQGIGIYQEIDLCEYTDPIPERVFSENDICLIGVPSYGGRVPRTAVERINGFKGMVHPLFWWYPMEIEITMIHS